MKQPSLDLQSLAKQVDALLQKKQILETTIKVSEREWQTLKTQISDDTEATIEASRKAIRLATKEAREELDRVQKEAQSQADCFDKERSAYQETLTEIEADITQLEHDKKVLSQTNADLASENRDLNSEIVVHKKSIEELVGSKNALQAQVSDLETRHNVCKEQVLVLEQKIHALEGRQSDSTQEYEAKKLNYEGELAQLQLKSQNLAAEIIENRAAEDEVRKNLAVWQQKLEDRDKNLRIREAKVDQQESSITRNYNLLKL